MEHVLIKCLFNKVLPYLFIPQGYGKTLLHQKGSELKKKYLLADVYKIVVLESFAIFNSCS